MSLTQLPVVVGGYFAHLDAVLVESGEPAATITGTAEELYRWLWGRGDEPASSGDAASLDALREAQAQGMQGVDRRW